MLRMRFSRVPLALLLALSACLGAIGAEAQTRPAPVSVKGSVTVATPRTTLRARRHGRGLVLPDGTTLQAKRQAISAVMEEMLRADRAARATLSKALQVQLPEAQMRSRLANVVAPSFDWTPLIPGWDVKDQGDCGCCYAFAASAAFEASWYIRNGERITVSEQCLLDRTNRRVNCTDGSWSAESFTEMMLQGVAKQADYPYAVAKQAPRAGVAKPYRALAWGFVGGALSPTTNEIKQALLLHGPLVYPVSARDTVANEVRTCELGMSNHELLIVGWDDSRRAWRVRNSWGTDWQDGGYGWIDYFEGGLGNPALWVEAECNRYPQPPIPLPAPCPELVTRTVGLRSLQAKLGAYGGVTASAQNQLGAVIMDLDALATSSSRRAAMSRLVDDGMNSVSSLGALVIAAGKSPGNGELLRVANEALVAQRGTNELAASCAAAFGIGVPPVSREFELLGVRVRLDSGVSSKAAGGVSLNGTISVWPAARPALRLTFRNATFTVHGTPALYNAYDGSGELVVGDGATSSEWGRASLRGIAPGKAIGTAKVTRFGHTFDVGYRLDGVHLSGAATWNGGDAGWKAVGGADGAEFHVVEPRVEVAVDDARVATTFCCRKLELRTKQRNPAAGNAPWASLELNPPCTRVDNDVVLDLMGRVFPPIADPNTIRRNECIALCPNVPNPPPGSRPSLPGPARDAYDTVYRVFEEGRRKHDECVNICTTLQPAPPPMPRLPSSITISVEVVVK